MSTHFSNFTAEAMRAFGEELAADGRARAEFIQSTRDGTFAMLAGFRKDHQEAEANRQWRARTEGEARHKFMEELRAGVHAMKNRFEQGRQDMARDLGQMSTELKAACDAFRNRPGRKGQR